MALKPPKRVVLSPRWSASVASASVALLVLVGLWQLGCAKGWFPSQTVPTPAMTWQALVHLTEKGTMLSHVGVSLGRLGLGVAVGTIGGIAAGILVGGTRYGRLLFQPVISLLSPVPPLVWTPVLIAVFGIDQSRIALVAIPTFFLVAFGTALGIRATDRRYVEVGRAFGLGWFQTMRRILFPSALPSILASLRTAAFLAWTVLVFAEMIASSGGLGWLINDARTFGRIAEVGAATITVAILAVATDAILIGAQRWLLRWQETYEGLDREVIRSA